MRCSICSWLVAATWVPQQRFVSTPGMETTRTGPTWSLGSPRVWAWARGSCVTRGSTRDVTHLVQLRVPDLECVDGDGECGPDHLVAALLHRGQVLLAHRPVHLNVGHAHLGLGVFRHPPGQSLEADNCPVAVYSGVLCDLLAHLCVVLLLQHGGQEVLARVLLHVVPPAAPVHHLCCAA